MKSKNVKIANPLSANNLRRFPLLPISDTASLSLDGSQSAIKFPLSGELWGVVGRKGIAKREFGRTVV
ncbi:MAG: hypothetical protein JNL58_01085 [Planctomyces sp.]|nr:hypothetical protein [Planctomyces sp.]